MAGNQPLLKPGEVAGLFRVDAKTVNRWWRDGKISKIKTPGGHGRYPRAEVAALLAKEGVKDPEAFITAALAAPRPAPVAHGQVPGRRDHRAR